MLISEMQDMAGQDNAQAQGESVDAANAANAANAATQNPMVAALLG